MIVKDMTLPIWVRANAWREILARLFGKLETKLNIFPEWLINPQTQRRLKLDMLYPEINVAIRFEGVAPPKGTPRLSLEEEDQKQYRDTARGDICEQHGIYLIAIDLLAESLPAIFRDIDITLSRAKRQVTETDKLDLISQARMTASDLTRRIIRIDDLKLYSDLWDDRSYRATASPDTAPPAKVVCFTVGMEVEHPIFGLGVVAELKPSKNDTAIVVDFLDSGRKTLAASLATDKLVPL